MVKGEFGGAPEALSGGFEIREVEVRADQEARNAEAYLDMMIRLLRTDGVRFPNNKQANFSWLLPVMDGNKVAGVLRLDDIFHEIGMTILSQ